ncbi:AraC family transcriptional regulator [Pseudomonas daroniae]|uniref:AraC family transcriptional regulator n=1 Tax=Phytopseudomonas daroniae TaxID=2487519 RepID=A0A4Q9QI23_9GAMM|nr:MULTISPECIES: AraC family transcriptional regulator [Pseudomonas]TBU73433.1 AraC family transcriptional regulator [Pseudomonas daroniae]TBU79185.1 AraC family transcriptional regulator [Pseudomonas sp. FRB 228]TBU88083.1 AraC family transcriptional regulator [Pseudomonas daroniae]
MSSLLSVRHYHQDIVCHEHDHAQLVFGLSGHLQFEVAGLGSRISRQILAVVPAGARHACDSRNGSECLVLDVPAGNWLEHHLGNHADASRRLLEAPQKIELSVTQNGLVNWLAASSINDPLIARQGAILLLASLNAETHVRPCAGLPLTALDAYIERHAAHPIQVADLASLAGLSTARFHNRFLEETGFTPMAYVRDKRLRLGRQLLHNSRLSVGEIAARVGYTSQSAFTAALSRHFGETPKVLRERQPRDK